MKKICMITTVSITMKTFVLETAKKLYEECGYEVTLVCNDDDEFRKIIPEYITFYPIKMSRGIDFSAFVSICNFIKLFKKEKFDLVQYSTPNASFYASIASRICNVKKRLYCQWGIRYVGLIGFSRKLFKLLEKITCLNSTDIRSVSHLNRQFGINEGLYKENKVSVIGYGGTIGVNLSQFDITKKEEWKKKIVEKYNLKNSIVFGFVGRITEDKGCKELLEAFRIILCKNKNVKLFIVGPKDIELNVDKELLEWAYAEENIVFTGMIENSLIPQYYSAMDILVHPTYREGFGMVIQEAGAMGIASLTTNIPGASEVMVEGKSCKLIEPKNSEQLKNAIQTFIDNRELISNMSKEAYKRTISRYERNIMINNQIKDYKKILER